MRWVFLWLAVILAAAAVLPLTAIPAAAQAGVTGRAIAVCVAPAAPGMTVQRAFGDSTGFDCATQQSTLGSGDFWVRSEALPNTISADGAFGVRTVSLWQRAVTLYALYPDGKIVRRHADDRRLARYIQLGGIVEFPLPNRDQRPVRLVWHVEGAANLRGILLGARVATPAQSAASNVLMGSLYAAFAGFALALLTHNLAMWRALRQRFQLHYILMLAMLMIYALSSSGALAWFGTDIANTSRLRVNYLSLALAAAAAIGFARHFFEARIFDGWVGRAATVITASLITSGLSLAILAPWHMAWLDRAYSLTFVATIGVVAPMMWRAWRLRSDYRWLFGLAWSAPIVLAALRVGNSLHPVRWSFWLDNSTLIAMTAEALISSLAIAYRVRQVARERDIARAEEIAARLLADTDPLTGLLNRRAFLRSAAGRGPGQLLLILDIDHFKQVNDTIGHDGGDEVLRRVARLLRSNCPADGLAVRLGGEEFAVLASVATAPDATALLSGLRAMRMPFDLTVTASIGVCEGRMNDDTDWKALYTTADRALFAAKAAGRDRARKAGDCPALAA